MNFVKYGDEFRAAQLTDSNIASAAEYYELNGEAADSFVRNLRRTRAYFNGPAGTTHLTYDMSEALDKFDRCMEAAGEDSVAVFILSTTDHFNFADAAATLSVLEEHLVGIDLLTAVDVYRKVAGGNCRLLGFELNDAALLAFSAIGISAVSD